MFYIDVSVLLILQFGSKISPMTCSYYTAILKTNQKTNTRNTQPPQTHKNTHKNQQNTHQKSTPQQNSIHGNSSVVHGHVQFLLLFETCNLSSSGVLQPDGNLRARNELSLTQDLSASWFLTLSFSPHQITLSCCEIFKVTQQLWLMRAVIVFG